MQDLLQQGPFSTDLVNFPQVAARPAVGGLTADSAGGSSEHPRDSFDPYVFEALRKKLPDERALFWVGPPPLVSAAFSQGGLPDAGVGAITATLDATDRTGQSVDHLVPPGKEGERAAAQMAPDDGGMIFAIRTPVATDPAQWETGAPGGDVAGIEPKPVAKGEVPEAGLPQGSGLEARSGIALGDAPPMLRGEGLTRLDKTRWPMSTAVAPDMARSLAAPAEFLPAGKDPVATPGPRAAALAARMPTTSLPPDSEDKGQGVAAEFLSFGSKLSTARPLAFPGAAEIGAATASAVQSGLWTQPPPAPGPQLDGEARPAPDGQAGRSAIRAEDPTTGALEPKSVKAAAEILPPDPDFSPFAENFGSAAATKPGLTSPPFVPHATYSRLALPSLSLARTPARPEEPALPAAGPTPAAGFAGLQDPTERHKIPAQSLAQLTSAIVETIARTADGRTTLTLSPEELGKVRVAFHFDRQNSAQMVVTLGFDRPESMELFRRHADQLADALRSAGYAGVEIGFGAAWDGGSRHPLVETATADRDGDGIALAEATVPVLPPPPLGHKGTLDLRL